MVGGKQKTRVEGNLLVKNERIERVSTYKNLRTVVNEDLDNIRARIEQARQAFQNIRNVLLDG